MKFGVAVVLFPLFLGACSSGIVDGFGESEHMDIDFEFGSDYVESRTTQSDFYVRRGNQTVRAVRPDATGYFPGDPHGVNAPAHHSKGAGAGLVSGSAGKYTAPVGKYTPSGSVSPKPSSQVGHSTVRHGHDVNCLVYSGIKPVYVGQNFTCHSR